MSILLVLDRNTPCMYILLVVESERHPACPPYCLWWTGIHPACPYTAGGGVLNLLCMLTNHKKMPKKMPRKVIPASAILAGSQLRQSDIDIPVSGLVQHCTA
jgi:hypothetical protein